MKRCLAVLVILMTVSVFSHQATAEILGYPWYSWGELSFTPSNDIERGSKLDMYVEQGIDWMKLGESDFVLNTFAGIGLTKSDHTNDFWNNRWRPVFGGKVKHPLKAGLNNWGVIDLGIRGEYFGYFNDSSNNAWRAVAFLQWSAGGDWKNRR
ncbi:MAG: hypothetical protein AB1552_02010 [Nitrospirota bacterium]